MGPCAIIRYLVEQQSVLQMQGSDLQLGSRAPKGIIAIFYSRWLTSGSLRGNLMGNALVVTPQNIP